MFSTLSQTAQKHLQTEEGIDGAVIDWSPPQNPEHGDIATSVALRFAKKVNKSPREIAEKLANALASHEDVEKAEVAGAGYVNVRLKPSAFLAEVAGVEEAIKPKKKGKDAPVIIEYSQPNIAKPLGIHHVIGTVLGQALVNLYRHAGENVVAWNYIGDWGTQFGKLAVAYETWGGGKPIKDHSLDDLLALYVKFHEELKTNESLENKGREAFRKLEAGDEALRSFWKDVVSVTKASLAGIYDRLGVSFDLDLGESFYEDKMGAIVADGKKKGVFIEGKEGSLIVEFPEESGMPPYLILKGDGATLYSTRDIAQMRYRMDEYAPKEILILTDIAQKLHFEQLASTCEKLGWSLPSFENVLFGRMRFADKSMSTRKGNILKLEHVLDEAVARAEEVIVQRGESIQTDNPKELAEMMGVGALVYGILSQNRKMDMVFDWDKMLSFEGNSAPYLQYTYARAKSVLRKGGVEGKNVTVGTVETLTPHERRLFTHLLQFAGTLEASRTEKLPHKLANYLYELAQRYNTFYNSDTILDAEEPQRGLRLRLTSLTAAVIKAGASLLTLRVPERM
jgi:arginyl-tRNA synthetase